MEFPLQGENGQAYLRKFNLPPDTLNSFLLVEAGYLYTQSTGALRMLKHIGGAWSLLYAFIIVPKFIRDAVYRLIANNRYKWFGKQETCWLPTPGLKEKFLA